MPPEPPTSPSANSTNDISGKAQRRILIAIGAAYVLYSLSDIAATFFSANFCLFGCNEVNYLAQKELTLVGGLLILALIETYGLVKRQLWARIFGVILFFLYLVPSFLTFFYGDPVPMSEYNELVANYHLLGLLMTILMNPFIWVILIATVCLFIPKLKGIWIYSGLKTIIIFLLLTTSGILIMERDWQYHIDSRATQSSQTLVETKTEVSAGQMFKNDTRGFQLTLPVNVSVSDSYVEHDNLIDFQISGKDAFYIKIEPKPIYQKDFTDEESFNEYVKTIEQYDHTAFIRTTTQGTINNVPYLRTVSSSRGQINTVLPDITYLSVHNGSIFSFRNYGNLSAGQFDPIIQTLIFTK